MNHKCIDQSRIKNALCEAKNRFDHMNPYICGYREFNHHMELLFYRCDIFSLDTVINHAKAYSYRMDENSLNAVLSSLDKHSFKI
jgi:hypothetical protein